jgi:DNA-binding NarL/FixJ family response regulator
MATPYFHPARSQETSRILIVDDHPMVRERLADVVRSEPDLEVCGEAEDTSSALEVAERTSPDLVIVDLSLRNSHGLDLIKDLRVRWPPIAILVVSMHEESLHAERVLRAGALGYITKQEATKNILIAIRTVLGGDIYLSSKVAREVAIKVAGSGPANPRQLLDRLSDRELRVFELIGRGQSTRQIAQALKLGVPTIETYRARIKDKLRLKNSRQLLQHAILWNQTDGSRS